MELFQRVGPIKHCKVLYPVSGPSQLCAGAVGHTYRVACTTLRLCGVYYSVIILCEVGASQLAIV